MKKRGTLKTNNVILWRHELRTVEYFLNQGYNVELIPTSDIEGIHTPDIKMFGLFWEMKSPKGRGNNLIKNTIQDAARQSENIIIDLRRIKLTQENSISQIKKEFMYSKRIKKIIIITKFKKTIELYK